MADVEVGINALFRQGCCSVDGCDRDIWVKSSGWCSIHYNRWRVRGDLDSRRVVYGIHICDVCGLEFKRKPGRKGRFCTAACTQAWNKSEQGKSRESVCLTCGRGFVAKRLSRARWCSRSCVNLYRYIDDLSFNEMKRRAGFKGRGNKKSCFVWFRDCADCAVRFCAKRLSQSRCLKCLDVRSGPRQQVEKPCLECGVLILGRANKKRCAACARKRSVKRARLLAKPYRKNRQRARKFGVVYEKIDPIAVFEAAKWMCALCGIRVLKSKRGSSHHRAPELDHVVPMSLGGPHTLDNVQLACRACNHSKGATVRGQLSIFSCVSA